MKTVEQVRKNLEDLKRIGKGFTPLSDLFFSKNTKRLTIHGYIVANMMWEGLDEPNTVIVRSNKYYKEYDCKDAYIDQAIDLLDKQTDLVYFIDSPEGYGDSNKGFVIKCFGDIRTFENLLKLTNGSFIDCVKKKTKRE